MLLELLQTFWFWNILRIWSWSYGLLTVILQLCLEIMVCLHLHFVIFRDICHEKPLTGKEFIMVEISLLFCSVYFLIVFWFLILVPESKGARIFNWEKNGSCGYGKLLSGTTERFHNSSVYEMEIILKSHDFQDRILLYVFL